MIGAAVFKPSMSTAQALAESDGSFGAVAEETLLARLHLKVGDSFRLGEARFVLRAVLIGEPDRLAVGVGFGCDSSFRTRRWMQPNSSSRGRSSAGRPAWSWTDRSARPTRRPSRR